MRFLRPRNELKERTKKEKDSVTQCTTLLQLNTELSSIALGIGGDPRARSTIVKENIATHRCQKFWFYSHDVIDCPYVRTYVRTSIPPCIARAAGRQE